MLAEVLGGSAEATAFTSVLALIFIGIVALLFAAVRALFQGRRWGRGPVVTWQLLVFAIGVSQGDLTWLVVLLVVLPVAVTVGLLVPASVEWTNRPTPPRAVA